MMMPQTIYGAADVARLLRVTNAAVSNYQKRYDDTPKPACQTVDGRYFWTLEGMREWHEWHVKLHTKPTEHRITRQAEQAIDQLRQRLEG